MKTKIFAAAFAVLLLASCKDDDDKKTTYPEENPLAAYLQNTGFDQSKTDFINSGQYEFGYTFRPKVKGKINAFTFKIPDNATNMRVTIWNAATKTPIRTMVIPNVVANTEIRQNIDPLYIDPSSEYLISYNGNDWYNRRRTAGTDATYPVDAGNISITSYLWNSTTAAAQNYPLTFSKYYYAGDLSIVFQRED